MYNILQDSVQYVASFSYFFSIRLALEQRIISIINESAVYLHLNQIFDL